MMDTANNQVQIYNNAIETFQNGGDILIANQMIVSKALAAGSSILEKIEANGGKLTADMDRLCNDYLVRVGQRKKELEEARKPVTQIMDEVKKMFTSEESKLDVKSSTTIPFKVQQHRNNYAKAIAEEERLRKEAAQREADKARAKVNIMAQIEWQLNAYLNSYLLDFKTKMHQGFNAITLENFEEKAARIKQLECVYPHSHISSFKPVIRDSYYTPAEVEQLQAEIISEKWVTFSVRFTQEVEELKQQLIDRLPSKKSELENLATAAAEDLARLEREKAEREKAEAERLAKEAAEAERRAMEEVELKKTAGETEVLFDQAAAVVAVDSVETRQGYEIIVQHHGGYVQIFQFWFEREGKNLPIDKIGNVKLDQMKAFCEKHAHKTGEKIESKFLVYEETYKAVNRKAK